MNNKPIIFISYSHKDRAFVEELLIYLKPIQQITDFVIWDDRKIAAGDRWFEAIKEAISKASVAILLVSPDYLASDWVLKEELPFLLEHQTHRGLRIFPVILRPSLWKATPLAYYQLWPRDGKALSTFRGPERDKLLVNLVEQVQAVLSSIEDISEGESRSISVKEQTRIPSEGAEDRERKRIKRKPKAKRQAGRPPQFFISHAKEDGDFAENLKFRLDKKGLLGCIDIDILEAGVDWRKEIDEAILASHAVILILSPDSKTSEYVTYEWAFALGSGLRIVPLMLKDTPIHPRLEVFQYMDFTNRRSRPWNRLLNLLREIIDTEHVPNQSVQATQEILTSDEQH
ncbi:MAG: toll/interleukin-1 receptor domain-containing protein [Pyrinomonadaceae bacterium]